MESLLKRKEIPSHPIKWKTVLWIFTVSCPCSSLTVSNWTLTGRGCNWQSNAEIYIWPPALQFFSLFTVLIISPRAHKIFKNQSFSISIACTLFFHVYSSSINIINILPPKKHTESYQICSMYNRVRRSTEGFHLLAQYDLKQNESGETEGKE